MIANIPPAPVVEGATHLHSGKVRDLYAPLDAEGKARRDQLLLVASDRISSASLAGRIVR